MFEDFISEDFVKLQQSVEPKKSVCILREIEIELNRLRDVTSTDDNDEFEDKLNDCGEADNLTKTIKSRSGKPKKIYTAKPGKTRTQYQMCSVTGDSPDLDQLILAEIPNTELVSSCEADEWFPEMTVEVQAILRNDTWRLVQHPANQMLIGIRMILRKDGLLARRKAQIILLQKQLINLLIDI